MRVKLDILQKIVRFEDDLTSLEKELSVYSWDSEYTTLLVKETDVLDALKRSISNEISIRDLEHWAKLIEFRDDIDFENEGIQEIIFELANSEINGEITKSRLEDIVKNYS